MALHVALPAIEALAERAPALRCELIEAEPEQALSALALGDVDVVLGDEWRHQPWRLSTALTREELLRDPVRLVLTAGHQARSLAELSSEPWASGHPGMAWEEVTRRLCREHGGFEPLIRHRTENATVALALVARGLAVTLLPDLALRDAGAGVETREVPGRGADDLRHHARDRRGAAIDARGARGAAR